MFFAYNEAQEEFRRTVRTFFERHVSSTELPKLVRSNSDLDDATWKAMANQLGLQGLIIHEKYGGGGFGPIELGMVLEEVGRALLPGPIFATIALGTTALVMSNNGELQAAHLPDIVKGERTATLALTEPGDRGGKFALAATATSSDSTHMLDGDKTNVYHGDQADLIVVAARNNNEPSLFLIKADAPGLERERVSTLDPTRSQARIRMHRTPATLLGGEDMLQAFLLRATAATAAEQVGGAQACIEIATAYAKERKQFGRVIGSFQAVKHICANMLLLTEAARTATWYASWACASAPEEVATAVPIAKHAASEAYTFASRYCIQVLGGIGFTWEHPAHLHYKRAVSSEQFLGAPQVQLERLADEIFSTAR